MKHTIAFRHKLVILPESETPDVSTAIAVVAELLQFGYVPDNSALEVMSKTSKKDLLEFAEEIIQHLRTVMGALHNYVPFWKGFPDEVMEKSEEELLEYQLKHYHSDGKFIPNEWTKSKNDTFEKGTYITYKGGTASDFDNIFTTLVSGNNSLTPQDTEDVKWFVKNHKPLNLPDTIPFKENLTMLASLGVDVPVKTVTDVLRIAVGMSGGDVSLPPVPAKLKKANAWSKQTVENEERKAFKFKNFNRVERRFIMSLLEKTNCNVKDAVLHRNRWIRLGEKIHPGEFSKTYKKSASMFSDLRNTKVKSWYSEVNEAFEKSTKDGVHKLSERPGEFVRRLDWMLRTFVSVSDQKLILDTLQTISPRVSNKVLFEVLAHMESRTYSKPRKITVKGRRTPVILPTLGVFTTALVDKVRDTVKTSLQDKFSKLEDLGNVWIDESLKNIPLPSNMRSLEGAITPYIRGQRLPIEDSNKVLRFYLHWFDKLGNEDVDLTATCFSGDSSKVNIIGWNGSHRTDFGCYSGDVRHRKGACAEYIDINIEKALTSGYRYVILDARNYTGRAMNTLKQGVVGWMGKDGMSQSLSFVPKTITNAITLQSKVPSVVVGVVDLETREFIFLDIDSEGIPVASRDTHKLKTFLNAYIEPPTFSVYDLLKLHAESRGTVIADADKADTVFNYEDFSTSYVKTLEYMGI